MIKSKQDLYECRSHIMRNIQLADNKATSLLQTYIPLMSATEKIELLKLYNEILFPVVVHDEQPDGYEPFKPTFDENILEMECKVVKDILDAKYNKISKMRVIINNYIKRITNKK